jgi:hypothetical protein
MTRVPQLLGGAVLEANTTLASEDESRPADGDDEQLDAAPPEPSRDEQLTGRFRAFAEERGDGDD